jgi:hypothetical protein
MTECSRRDRRTPPRRLLGKMLGKTVVHGCYQRRTQKGIGPLPQCMRLRDEIRYHKVWTISGQPMLEVVQNAHCPLSLS